MSIYKSVFLHLITPNLNTIFCYTKEYLCFIYTPCIYDTNWQTTLDFNQISFISSFYTLCTNIPVVKITLWRSFYTVIWLSIICLRTIKPLNEFLFTVNSTSSFWMFKVKFVDSNILNFGHEISILWQTNHLNSILKQVL
jgi:hypothetical protein